MCWIASPYCFLTTFSRFFPLCNGFWKQFCVGLLYVSFPRQKIGDILSQTMKLSYSKQIARQQRTHSNNNKFSEGEDYTGNEIYGKPVAAAAAVWSLNFSVGSFFTEENSCDTISGGRCGDRKHKFHGGGGSFISRGIFFHESKFLWHSWMWPLGGCSGGRQRDRGGQITDLTENRRVIDLFIVIMPICTPYCNGRRMRNVHTVERSVGLCVFNTAKVESRSVTSGDLPVIYLRQRMR